MTRYEKIAISLPSRVAENARRAVKAGEADSLSAYIVSALEEKMKPGDLQKLLQAWIIDSGGPLTEQENREIDARLGVTNSLRNRKPRTKRRRKR